jgi:hypothetical protein
LITSQRESIEEEIKQEKIGNINELRNNDNDVKQLENDYLNELMLLNTIQGEKTNRVNQRNNINEKNSINKFSGRLSCDNNIKKNTNGKKNKHKLFEGDNETDLMLQYTILKE